MLELLHIQNVAIVEDVTLEFSNGLTVITGETGAGKSLLMIALKLALGERASADILRTGATKACIEAVFSPISADVLNCIETFGLGDDNPGNELIPSVILRRELNNNGQSRAYVNGRLVTLAQLKELASLLIDIHGQHDGTMLFSQAHQLKLLDNYGDCGTLFEQFTTARQQYHETFDKIVQLKQQAASAKEQQAYLEFQMNEIDTANLRPGEDQELLTKQKRLTNAEHIITQCNMLLAILNEGNDNQLSVTDLINTATKSFNELIRLDSTQEGLAKQTSDLRYTVEDICFNLRQYAEQIQANPQELEEVNSRLQLISTLKSKYGGTIESILERRDTVTAELNTILNFDTELKALDKELEPRRQLLLQLSEQLSRRRAKTADVFTQLVTKEMHELNLPKATFDTNLKTAKHEPQDIPASGNDHCDFLIMINPGEEAKPLRKSASGGEISRIMLAIKGILAYKDTIQTLIFDEIDTGISGDAAGKVGDKLEKLGDSAQVIAITHLPQIAARGKTHLLIDKEVHKDKTSVRIEHLDGDERVKAVAAMIVGRPPDKESLQYAKVLLNRSKR